MNEFEKRRTGTPFWRACERCEELYNLLGVPIVRAKTEGEALCALLNLKGVVDGIISNDGDCFLFGARTLYTKFSIENLREGRVMRYDADNLSACLDDDDSDAVLTALGEKGGSDALADVVNLTRSDLIAFAILTGSDVVGGGFPKVGCRKALRFIRKCQIDNPVRSMTASHDEMMSWASSSKYPLPTLDCPDTNKKCSVCFHVGTKSSHLTHGCLICETRAGEPCLQVSGGDKFRKSLRNKALSLVPAFDPKSIFDIYQSPNDNQIPLPFIGMGSKGVAMRSPNLDGLLCSTFIIRGKSYAESRKYILDSLSRLMAKVEISSQLASGGTQIDCNSSTTKCVPKENKPVPIKLLKTALRSSTACYEVLWKIPLSARGSDENRLDEFEFATIEEQATVKKRYPDLVSTFVSNEKERHNQGRAEQERRRAFVDAIAKQAAVGGNGDAMHSTLLVDKPNKPKKSHIDFFAKNKFIPTSASGDASNLVKASVPSRCRSQTYRGMGDDVAKLLEASGANVLHCPNAIDNDSIQSALSNLSTDNIGINSTARVPLVTAYESPYKFRLTPSHVHFLRASGSSTQRHGSDNEYLGTDVQKG
jgi:flap endonuclease GEN